MIVLQIIIGVIAAVGVGFLLADFMKIPSLKASKAANSVGRKGKKKTGVIELSRRDFATKLAGKLHLNEFKRANLVIDLRTANMEITPEQYNYSGWIYSNELSHSRVKSCQYGDFSEIEFGAHSTMVKFESVSATQHKYYDFCADCNHIIGTESLESHTFVSRTENGRIYHECSLCGYSYSEAVTYTISYNANGGEGEPAAQVKIHGATLTLSSTIPTRAGYDFLGWVTTSTATRASYSAGGSYTGNANATLYAVW